MSLGVFLRAPDWRERQALLNDRTRGHWREYANHRRSMTTVITKSVVAGARVALLGAGNCNDIQLDRLLRLSGQVDLIDVDLAAVLDGVDRQKVAKNRVRLIEADLLAAPPAKSMRSTYELVVSCCVLTQLIDQVEASGPAGALQIRDRHLGYLAELLSPGGLGLLITDMVSSQTCVTLQNESVDIANLVPELIRTGNFFTGTNPLSCLERVALGAGPLEACRQAGITAAWLWDTGDSRRLVYALRFSKAS